MTEVNEVRLRRLRNSVTELGTELAAASPENGGRAAMMTTIRQLRTVSKMLYDLETMMLEAAYVDGGASYRELGLAYGGRRDSEKPMIAQNVKRDLAKRGIVPQGQRPQIQKPRGPRQPKAI